MSYLTSSQTRLVVSALVLLVGLQACGKKGAASSSSSSSSSTTTVSSTDYVYSYSVPELQKEYGNLTVITQATFNNVSVSPGTYTWASIYTKVVHQAYCPSSSCDWRTVNYNSAMSALVSMINANQAASQYRAPVQGLVEFRSVNTQYNNGTPGTQTDTLANIVYRLMMQNYQHYQAQANTTASYGYGY